MKRITILALCVIICICIFAYFNRKVEEPKKAEIEKRKGYCYFFKSDTSLSSGTYYVDIETKDKNTITVHYYTNYMASNVKNDFDKTILEASCTYAGYDEETKTFKSYNKTCKYDYDDYIVEYYVDEEKDFDTIISKFENNEDKYECIEIKKPESLELVGGSFQNVYKTSEDTEYTYKYKYFKDGSFEKTVIRIYSGEPNKWISFEPYEETTEKGYYSFDGTNLYQILYYKDGGYNLEYDKGTDSLTNNYVRVKE